MRKGSDFVLGSLVALILFSTLLAGILWFYSLALVLQ